MNKEGEFWLEKYIFYFLFKLLKCLWIFILNTLSFYSRNHELIKKSYFLSKQKKTKKMHK